MLAIFKRRFRFLLLTEYTRSLVLRTTVARLPVPFSSKSSISSAGPASSATSSYKFMWQDKLVRESAKQGNDKVARNMESAHPTAVAKGEVGIREKKAAPTLKEFPKEDFLALRDNQRIKSLIRPR